MQDSRRGGAPVSGGFRMNWLTLWAQHGSKAIGIALAAIGGLLVKYPSILTDIAGPYAAPIGLVIAGVLTLTHSATAPAILASLGGSSPPTGGSGTGGALKSLAPFVLLPLVGWLAGCTLLESLASDPAVISDVSSGLVAVLEASGTPEATINQGASAALATAQGAELTLTALAGAVSTIPGLSGAVNQFLTENPKLSSTEADANAWLAALVQATTPGTTAEVSAQAKLAARRARAAPRASPAAASAAAASPS